MARDAAYRKAEEKIEEALQSGATDLLLSGMALTELPESIKALTKLQVLHLDHNQLTTLPESILVLTRLQTLYLNSNELTAVPESITALTQLQTLRLDFNQLTTLPGSIAKLTQLQRLDLDNNELTPLPESIAALTQLQTLYLDNNQLTTLPESIAKLTQLQELYLSDNQLTTLPESIAALTQLQELELSDNQLTTLPESIAALTQLGELNLNNNQLKTLPESITALTQLQELYLADNQLTTLPESITALTQLQTLSLDNNQLTTLPESIAALTQLQTLHLSSNLLTTLPESIAALTQLQTLHLSSNLLTTLPESIEKLTLMKYLFLHGNDALGIPAEILGPTLLDSYSSESKSAANPATILNYYFSTRGSQGRALRELKLIVVGRGGAGKTSLIRRLNGQTLNLKESETHGINIRPLEIECADGPVTARVWDFGGQHVLHAMHEFFLTERSLYLLVLGEREDMAERDAAYWLQLIRSYAGDAPVVVALNKSQGRPRELDRDSLNKNYGPILGWVATECAKGGEATIEALREALTDAADGMQEVRDLFPAKWWKIKAWLENMTDPYLEYKSFQARCDELDEHDPTKQDTLAAWLNDLGIAINYTDDERLHDTTVLRPDWLANGIYAILRANDTRHPQRLAPDAMLTPEMLGPIYVAAEKLKMLKAKEYPQDKWSFLLRLMSLFQLAFPIDDEGQKLLVPSLLPVETPPDCDEPTSSDRTRIRYEFSVVPGPLIPRLLVRTFSLIDDERLWRRGALLRYGDARARVWMTPDERWVQVTAVGSEADRDKLLMMVRGTLQELFNEYQDLHVVEQWEFKESWVPRKTLEDIGVLQSERDRMHGAAMVRHSEKPVRLFVSYSHVDSTWFGRLRPLLKFDTPTDLAYAWHDQELKAGDRWNKEIEAELEEMDVFVCLLSFDSLASGYIKDVELKRALEREELGEVVIVPIVLYPMNVEEDCPELHDFAPLPAWGKCWRDFEREGGYYQDAHQAIRDGLREAIDKVKAKRKAESP